MTQTLPQAPAPNRTDSRRAPRGAARGRRASHFSEAVVAAYINDISTRERPTVRRGQPRP